MLNFFFFLAKSLTAGYNAARGVCIGTVGLYCLESSRNEPYSFMFLGNRKEVFIN